MAFYQFGVLVNPKYFYVAIYTVIFLSVEFFLLCIGWDGQLGKGC